MSESYDKNKNPIYKYEPREFPYKSLKDPRYIKDRNDFFRENGSGWWYNSGKSKANKTGFTRPNRKKNNVNNK